ncbi:hypothetical protein B0T17DRAFT_590829 [Bombardia bombarda]|uniref:RNA polymerase II subunit A C-terminal domain phosphatase n=1 Tax=Bombardia bombarda TaxID=252184 RepID=A0AA39X0U0_9PEZI|nr:hypothetical protein B0T17DRAFT_590829 [Bombardia bombarda]
MSKTIRLGGRLRYPITIVRLLKSPGETVKKQEFLIQYSFKWMKTVGDTIRGETWEEEQTTIADWESPADGELKKWHIKEGQLIERDAPCMDVKEECSHGIQFQGLCGWCGKDMTEVNWAAESRDTERAPISMVHDQTNLTVSQIHAQRTEQELQRRLLQARKLSLVVDLDQTIIHACIDPTVGEWQRDPANPNHDSVKDVKAFQLEDGPRGLARGCWYYIKMRPGLEGFLKRIATMYELHVYTMGTRAYAQNVARIVDPNQKLFGNRVISRDENGNMVAKSLGRLFPVNTNMVLIIDDRADVWPRNRGNLIKVSPYDFFKGIGDINSSFLPRRQDLLAADPVQAADPSSPAIGESKPVVEKVDDAVPEAGNVSALEELISMSGGEDSAITKRQVEEQERTLEKQIKDRPLQLLQEKLDKEDEEAEKTSTPSEDGEETPSSPTPHHRHQVLLDHDCELEFLEQHLTLLHKTYYEEYDRNCDRTKDVDLSAVPDVGSVMEKMKSRALRGCKVVLSGLLPIGVEVERSEIGMQMVSFGAQLRSNISRDVTHLVVNSFRPRTKKMRQAARIPNIKVVNQDWLAECFSRWMKVDERPYKFNIHSDDQLVSDTDDPDENGTGISDKKLIRTNGLRLKLVSATGETHTLNEDGDENESDNEDGALEEEEGLVPDELADGQLSPIDTLKTFNWGSADEELNEFLASGSDDDDDDEDEEDEDVDEDDKEITEYPEDEDMLDRPSDDSVTQSSKKRKASDEDDEADLDENSILAKRLRRTRSRGVSSLRNQYVADDAIDSSLPTPQVTGDEDDVASQLKSFATITTTASQQQQDGGAADNFDDEFDDIDEAELEADFMAEFEAADLAPPAPAPAPAAADASSGADGGDVGNREKG